MAMRLPCELEVIVTERPPSRAEATAKTSELRQEGSKGEIPLPLSFCPPTFCWCLPWVESRRGQRAKVMLSTGVGLLGCRAGQRSE